MGLHALLEPNLYVKMRKNLHSILTLILCVLYFSPRDKANTACVLDETNFMRRTMTTAYAGFFSDSSQIGRYMALKYNAEQHREYLNMLDKAAQRWLEVFDHNMEFYSAVYWDLLTRLWKEDKPIRRTDALRFITSIKSASTAGKYIDVAIRQGFLCETTNPHDARSKLLELSSDMRVRLDAYFDDAISELRQTYTLINQDGSVPEPS